MTRLLLASYYYPPSIGGLERQSHLLARELVRRHHSVRVISARLPGFESYEEIDGVQVERVSPGRGSRWRKMATYLAGLSTRVLEHRARVDVLQVQQALYPAAAMSVLSLPLRLPLVVRNSGSGHHGAVNVMSSLPLGSFGLRLIARRAQMVSLSDEMTEEMRNAGFERVVHIPNGVEIPPPVSGTERAIARERLSLKGAVAVYMGRLATEKGLDLLLRAWSELDAPVTLLLIGDGPERERLKREVDDRPSLANRIRFTGNVTPLRSVLAAADLFVLPSESEGISNALLEAMALGLPSVATAVDGNREVLRDQTVGLLVPQGDPHAFGDAVVELISNSERARAIGRAARAHVESHYSVEKMVDAYERLYERLLL